MPDRADLLVVNASTLLTLAGPTGPRTGEHMRELGAIDNGAAAISGGAILETGTTTDLLAEYPHAPRLDANGGLVMPGFVDCHTHLVYAGSRANELALRLDGATYLDILAAGGGIHSTVRATRAASQEELTDLALKRLGLIAAHGTTTVEVKSGYGLELETERKILAAAIAAGQSHALDIVTTFLGAHTVPKDVDRGEYLDMLVDEALPALNELAEFCDVFCEAQAFTLDETQRILAAAKTHGYKLKVHAGQFSDLGAAGLAAPCGAISADHLECVSDEQLQAMKDANTVAVLLPGTPLYLLSDNYADARRMIDAGVPVAVATDFNPGSCPSFSMPMMIALACLKMHMTVEEAITAATVNAACAIDRSQQIGSLEPGRQADLIVLDATEPAELISHFGTNLVRQVIKKGKVICENRQYLMSSD
ncbi:MAG: imidazolonepropionase [Planctomycetota bacterium]|jgi:imidazolonepropionase